MNKLIRYFLTLFFILSNAGTASGQNKLLGKIDFPNSGASEAQSDFIEGVLYLHNFEYEEAARSFRRAQKIDPDFAMAYWGEAQTYNHPIWMQQDRQAAMEVLKRLGPTLEARQTKAKTQREKDYLHTIEVLYGNTPESNGKTKEERDDLYRQAMKQLHEKYSKDNEAAVFYGLSILGTAHEGRDFRIYMQAAAVLMQVWNENKQHPGAAHYLIHSFDDPIHAPLGLPMANAYSKIVPAAAHAQHMTSHIFLALGMWQKVIEANLVARDVQTTRQEELDERPTVCGHYTWWLQYGYLQNGASGKAEKVLQKCYQRVNNSPNPNELWHFSVMKAHQIVDSENWHKVDSWRTSYQPKMSGSRNYYFTLAYAAVQTGNIDRANDYLNNLKQTPKGAGRDIQIMEIEALVQIKQGDTDQGIELLKEAVAAAFELPIDFGPPTIVKPTAELLGDVLMGLGKYKEAGQAYKKQLKRTPGRRLCLIGLNEIKVMDLN